MLRRRFEPARQVVHQMLPARAGRTQPQDPRAGLRRGRRGPSQAAAQQAHPAAVPRLLAGRSSRGLASGRADERLRMGA
jgi:hypothetical protein